MTDQIHVEEAYCSCNKANMKVKFSDVYMIYSVILKICPFLFSVHLLHVYQLSFSLYSNSQFFIIPCRVFLEKIDATYFIFF